MAILIYALQRLFNIIDIAYKLWLPITLGSRSIKAALGTCLPESVTVSKNVLHKSPAPSDVESLGICPSGWIPCSRQYNSQHALPIWQPACPIWMDTTSRYEENFVRVKWQRYEPFCMYAIIWWNISNIFLNLAQ